MEKTDEEKLQEVYRALDNRGLVVEVTIRRRETGRTVLQMAGSPFSALIWNAATPYDWLVDIEAGMMLKRFQFIPDIEFIDPLKR